MGSGDDQSITSSIQHAVGTRLLHTMWDQLPWLQTDNFKSIISIGDRQIIEERIA
jgi:hypothetical protein